MKTFRILAAAVAILALCTQNRLCAQPPGSPIPSPRPVVSPYINLLRNNSPAYLNYYGLVRPEFQFQNQLGGLQQSLAASSGAGSATDPATGLPLTGHSTQFLNTSHYFLNRGGQGQVGAAGAPRATTTPTSGTPPAYRGR